MLKLTKRIIVGLTALLLMGCVTLQDVQRATDLIRTDNELTRLLVEVRPNDRAAAAIDLNSLANHAKSQADALKALQGKESEAIAYYRIAATAYWRSGSADVVNDLFASADSGTDLCMQSGPKAPDRDCLFLRLVLPFAGLEANANDNGLSGILDKIDFNDGNATPSEIKDMQTVRTALAEAKPLVQKIFSIGQDDRLLSHANMRQYYCDNAEKAFGYYDSTAGVFVAKVKEFDQNFRNRAGELGVTLEQAREIRKIEPGGPQFCR
jgi:hypothetical protein